MFMRFVGWDWTDGVAPFRTASENDTDGPVEVRLVIK